MLTVFPEWFTHRVGPVPKDRFWALSAESADLLRHLSAAADHAVRGRLLTELARVEAELAVLRPPLRNRSALVYRLLADVEYAIAEHRYRRLTDTALEDAAGPTLDRMVIVGGTTALLVDELWGVLLSTRE